MSTISNLTGWSFCHLLNWYTTMPCIGAWHFLSYLFKIATRVELVPMPEYPQEPPSSVTLTECVDFFQSVWCNIKNGLAKATESQKRQADKKRPPQEKFHLGNKVLCVHKIPKAEATIQKIGSKIHRSLPYCKNHQPSYCRIETVQDIGEGTPRIPL